MWAHILTLPAEVAPFTFQGTGGTSWAQCNFNTLNQFFFSSCCISPSFLYQTPAIILASFIQRQQLWGLVTSRPQLVPWCPLWVVFSCACMQMCKVFSCWVEVTLLTGFSCKQRNVEWGWQNETEVGDHCIYCKKMYTFLGLLKDILCRMWQV